MLKLFEQGDLPDGSAWDPLGLPGEESGTAVEVAAEQALLLGGGRGVSPVFLIP